jgi:hypothetical protein
MRLKTNIPSSSIKLILINRLTSSNQVSYFFRLGLFDLTYILRLTWKEQQQQQKIVVQYFEVLDTVRSAKVT